MSPTSLQRQRVLIDRDVCPYLPDRPCLTEFEFDRQFPEDEYADRLARGWRRQGITMFRPVCDHCSECISIRLPVAQFRPTKSQRRNWRRNQSIRCEIRDPQVSNRQMEIFNAYHADMKRRRGWEYDNTTASEYTEGFLSGDVSYLREFAFFLEGRLIAVGLVDCLARCSSSIYFYHDPVYRQRGLGTYSLLWEMQVASAQERDYHYLGFWIRDCPSMAYKSRYGPHELLQKKVTEMDELPLWRPPSCETC